MARRAPQDVLQAVRDAVLEQRYVVTPHAMLALRDDRLDIIDIESAILTGSVERVFDDDARGARYEIVGCACDLTTRIGIVLRDAGVWLIITVYEIPG